jgi:hypothetical protein
MTLAKDNAPVRRNRRTVRRPMSNPPTFTPAWIDQPTRYRAALIFRCAVSFLNSCPSLYNTVSGTLPENRSVDDFVDAKAPAIHKLQSTSARSQQLARYQWLTRCLEMVGLQRMRNRVRGPGGRWFESTRPDQLSLVFSLYSGR